MNRRLGRTLALVGAALVLTLPASAAAELTLGGAFGGLVPWRGGPGYSAVGQILTSVFSSRLRVGGEVEYRSYEVTFLGLTDVDVNAYNARAILQFLVLPDMISPYVGIGIGVNLIDLDDPRIDAALGGSRVDTFGVGYGGIGFAGLHIPVGDRLSAFVEARTGIAFDHANDLEGELGPGDLSGFVGVAGFRLRF